MRRLLVFALGVITLACYIPLLAQTKETETGPPKKLQLIIEDVKPGKGAAHEKSEALWLAAFEKSKVPAYGIGMTTMTGRNEAWFVNVMGTWSNWDSWGKQIESNPTVAAEIQRVSASDGELINNTRTFYLNYISDLSYRPDFKLGEMRYFLVDTVRVRPGHGKEFSDLRKAINAAHEKANMDEHMLVYYASMGAAGGTYFIFEPLKSVSDMDEIEKWHGDGSEYQKALGEDFQKMSREFALNGLMSTESNMLSISPRMSFVSEDVAKVAPAFWHPKPAPSAKMTASKKATKETKAESGQ